LTKNYSPLVVMMEERLAAYPRALTSNEREHLRFLAKKARYDLKMLRKRIMGCRRQCEVNERLVSDVAAGTTSSTQRKRPREEEDEAEVEAVAPGPAGLVVATEGVEVKGEEEAPTGVVLPVKVDLPPPPPPPPPPVVSASAVPPPPWATRPAAPAAGGRPVIQRRTAGAFTAMQGLLGSSRRDKEKAEEMEKVRRQRHVIELQVQAAKKQEDVARFTHLWEASQKVLDEVCALEAKQSGVIEQFSAIFTPELQQLEEDYAAAFFLKAEAHGYAIPFQPAVHSDETEMMLLGQVEAILPEYQRYRDRVDALRTPALKGGEEAEVYLLDPPVKPVPPAGSAVEDPSWQEALMPAPDGLAPPLQEDEPEQGEAPILAVPLEVEPSAQPILPSPAAEE
jgi:hypothetical protein